MTVLCPRRSKKSHKNAAVTDVNAVEVRIIFMFSDSPWGSGWDGTPQKKNKDRAPGENLQKASFALYAWHVQKRQQHRHGEIGVLSLQHYREWPRVLRAPIRDTRQRGKTTDLWAELGSMIKILIQLHKTCTRCIHSYEVLLWGKEKKTYFFKKKWSFKAILFMCAGPCLSAREMQCH